MTKKWGAWAIAGLVAYVIYKYRAQVVKVEALPRVTKVDLTLAGIEASISQAPVAVIGAPGEPRLQMHQQINGVSTITDADPNNPGGVQHTTVVVGNTSYGSTWGGWDPNADYSETVAALNAQIAAHPNDTGAIAQLATMQALGLA